MCEDRSRTGGEKRERRRLLHLGDVKVQEVVERGKTSPKKCEGKFYGNPEISYSERNRSFPAQSISQKILFHDSYLITCNVDDIRTHWSASEASRQTFRSLLRRCNVLFQLFSEIIHVVEIIVVPVVLPN